MAGDTHTNVASAREQGLGSDAVMRVTPTTKLVLIYIGVLAVVGTGLGLYFLTNKEALGEQGYGGIAGWVIILLTVIGLIRLTIQFLVLRRTEYVLTRDSIRREYDLLYSEKSRELPISKVRGVELRRGRLQAMLGFGDVSFLAAGTNRSIGYIDFENTDNPHKVREKVFELMETYDGHDRYQQRTAEPTAGAVQQGQSPPEHADAPEADD
ncbi:PH domain-containing protein [Haloarchaeobius sp. HME9146]|uniref:PH domain-containing protein n=1 Tax=Haloarchaeobius sp. HME9146 TaxID=2978732 RepID=UPI0021C07B8B|nr:PH domain-containing protein [Haloarchaeobius sp. HME9146]MCT9096010.1 PH domain-containing protein [Haloarchaeobius sp. HME9146]